MKHFFNITEPYRFEWNDLRCFAMVLNVILIMRFGLTISWFGLGIAIVGLIKDLTGTRHINDILMHLSSAVLNVYFLSLLRG